MICVAPKIVFFVGLHYILEVCCWDSGGRHGGDLFSASLVVFLDSDGDDSDEF